jgi:hypothetical protein
MLPATWQLERIWSPCGYFGSNSIWVGQKSDSSAASTEFQSIVISSVASEGLEARIL